MKSTTSFLNDFFVQNGYFRDNSGGKIVGISSKSIKFLERKENYEDEKMGSKDVEYMPGPDID